MSKLTFVLRLSWLVIAGSCLGSIVILSYYQIGESYSGVYTMDGVWTLASVILLCVIYGWDLKKFTDNLSKTANGNI